jgi:hypothetical protein
MRMPFERLMEAVTDAQAAGINPDTTMGQLSERWGEPPERIMDAIDAVRVMRGECTYISLTDPS